MPSKHSLATASPQQHGVWRDTAPPTVTRNCRKQKKDLLTSVLASVRARPAPGLAVRAVAARAHTGHPGAARVSRPPSSPAAAFPAHHALPRRRAAPRQLGAAVTLRSRSGRTAAAARRVRGGARVNLPDPKLPRCSAPGGPPSPGLGPALTLGTPCSSDGRTDGLTDGARALWVRLRWPSGGGLVGHDASGHDRHRPLPAGAQIPAVRLLLLHPPRRPRAARPRDGGSWPPRRPGPAPRRRPDETSRQQPTHTRRTPISGRRTTARAPPRTSPPPTSSSTCSTTS